jgi:predicted DsbA family dithiol-disulfide isomerase
MPRRPHVSRRRWPGRRDRVQLRPTISNPNTLDAHRIIWLAGERGVQDAVVEALFLAYVTDGRDLSDRVTLAEIAAEAGLDRVEVDELLARDGGLEVVRAGEEQARRLGVSGVPFFVVNGPVAQSGAQPPELFRQAFGQAGDSVGAGEACEVDPASGDAEGAGFLGGVVPTDTGSGK